MPSNASRVGCSRFQAAGVSQPRGLRLGAGSREQVARLPVCAGRLGVHCPIVPLSGPGQKRATFAGPALTAGLGAGPGSAAMASSPGRRRAWRSCPSWGSSIAGALAEDSNIISTALPGRRHDSAFPRRRFVKLCTRRFRGNVIDAAAGDQGDPALSPCMRQKSAFARAPAEPPLANLAASVLISPGRNNRPALRRNGRFSGSSGGKRRPESHGHKSFRPSFRRARCRCRRSGCRA
jgi:hypothetical protein